VVFAVQMILGFFATAGLAAADWGAVARDRSELRVGGLVCVALACWTVATLTILTVNWTWLIWGGQPGGAAAEGAPLRTYRWAIPRLYGPRVAGGLFLALSLTALAPGVYAAFLVGSRLHELIPRRSRTRWTLTGALTAWLLEMSTEGVTIFGVFSVIGALV